MSDSDSDHWQDGPDFEDEEIGFECAGYYDGKHWVCPLIRSEDCDWECPEGGLSQLRKDRK